MQCQILDLNQTQLRLRLIDRRSRLDAKLNFSDNGEIWGKLLAALVDEREIMLRMSGNIPTVNVGLRRFVTNCTVRLALVILIGSKRYEIADDYTVALYTVAGILRIWKHGAR